MPAPAPYPSTSNQQPMFPALYLYPLNDSFVPKHVVLAHGQRVKIGRQTNAKTSPAERNGYFDSKVLSRQHAEVWEEGGKIFIKDVKSSNGTFINGERLSPEGLESEPFELKSDDIVEFGIDIVGEDNKTIIHHKVSTRIVCVFTEQDVQVAQRAEQHQHQNVGVPSNQAGPSNAPGPFNFGAPSAGASTQRRPPMQAQGLGGMGGMGSGMRPPGKSGLTFDHILSRLQGELQKSRETGAELHLLTGTMNEIHDTLGGSLPSNLPAFPPSLPPVRSGGTQPEPVAPAATAEGAESATALHDIQTQLHETQTSLAAHSDRVRALEGALAEQEAIKRDLGTLRHFVEERQQRSATEDHQSDTSSADEENDDSDAASILTLRQQDVNLEDPHRETRTGREDEETDEERRSRREELGRPRTPEPTGLGMHPDDFEESTSGSASTTSLRPTPDQVVDDLANRLSALTSQLENALALSNSLQAQHAAAQSTIEVLEGKVAALESLESKVASLEEKVASVQQTAAALPEPTPAEPIVEDVKREEKTSHPVGPVTAMLEEWKHHIEGQWTSVKEEWGVERERLAKAREEFDATMEARLEKSMDAKVAERVESALATFHPPPIPDFDHLANGDASTKSGLVTPPSPRSLSADSRKRSRKHRGRSRSRSNSPGGTDETAVEDGVDADGNPLLTSSPLRKLANRLGGSFEEDEKISKGKMYLASPEQSMRASPSLRMSLSGAHGDERADLLDKRYRRLDAGTVSTGAGVALVAVVMAAVLWRIKGEQ